MLQVSLSPYKNHESKARDIHLQVISYECGEYEKKAIDTQSIAVYYNASNSSPINLAITWQHRFFIFRLKNFAECLAFNPCPFSSTATKRQRTAKKGK